MMNRSPQRQPLRPEPGVTGSLREAGEDHLIPDDVLRGQRRRAVARNEVGIPALVVHPVLNIELVQLDEQVVETLDDGVSPLDLRLVGKFIPKKISSRAFSTQSSPHGLEPQISVVFRVLS